MQSNEFGRRRSTSWRNAVTIAAAAACLAVGGTSPADAQSKLDDLDFLKSKPYASLTSAEITAAKAAARKRKVNNLVFCADPGNMPLSSNAREGFQNKIAEAVGRAMGAHVSYFWRPYLERGLTRETFENNECQILLEMPTDTASVLTTTPIYRSTYVLAWREDKGYDIKSLDDPILSSARVGVFQHSAMRQAFARRGIKQNLDLHIISSDADLRPEKQPWRQVQRVVDGEIDIAAVWGPFAGWVQKQKNAPLTVRPVNGMEDRIPLEFSLSFGIQNTDVVMKFVLDAALEKAEAEITKILQDYGVPLVECANCIVKGTIPSHGTYVKPTEDIYRERYLESAKGIAPTAAASADQIVDRARLEAWLADGVDKNQELANAVLAGDRDRLRFLIEKGADVNWRDGQGFAPLHIAAKTRHSDMIELLLAAKASVDIADSDGITPLMYAVMRNHVPSIRALARGGADIERINAGGYRPLVFALSEGHYFAVEALIESGASVASRNGKEGLTPLMIAATLMPPAERVTRVARGPQPIELAALMIARGADPNDATEAGITPLMIAAGHDNASMIALLLRSGADPARRSKTGETALEIAEKILNERAATALKRIPGAARNIQPANVGPPAVQ